MSSSGRGHSFSVAVLSHRRPHLLARVLTGLAQLDHANFEIVVVGDRPSLDSYSLPAWITRQVRYVAFDGANICKSRNLAVEAASGDIVAFIDDDAVPEPDWLRRLSRAFGFPDVGGVGGLVRRGDGIRIEWAGGVFDRAAVEDSLSVRDELRVFDSETQVYANQFIGTMGANSAFRREAILSVGGFDESFRYYLDETDLMLRLAEAGWDAALVSTAEVHHLRDENIARDRLRTPRNLFEIAASKAYFCRRHLPGAEIEAELARFRTEKLDELDPYIRLGLVRYRDRNRLREQIDAGIADGLSRERTLPMAEADPGHKFRRFKTSERPVSVALCAGFGLASLIGTAALARRLISGNARVSYFGFHSGWAERSVGYKDGIWWHRGGAWRLDHRYGGKRAVGRSALTAAEVNRVLARRRFDIILTAMARPGAIRLEIPGTRRGYYARLAPGATISLEDAVDAVKRAAASPVVAKLKDQRPVTSLDADPEPSTMAG